MFSDITSHTHKHQSKDSSTHRCNFHKHTHTLWIHKGYSTWLRNWSKCVCAIDNTRKCRHIFTLHTHAHTHLNNSKHSYIHTKCPSYKDNKCRLFTQTLTGSQTFLVDAFTETKENILAMHKFRPFFPFVEIFYMKGKFDNCKANRGWIL